jgi:threonine/homoserine/homoserine lactone efflux protein
MMTQLFGFVAVSALVICAPGPDTALTIRNSIVGGRRGGMLTAGGIAAGQLVWTIATSLGIAGILQASQPAFTALKIIGAAYLVWLGLSNLANPKMAVFFLSLLPQFVPAASGGFVGFALLGVVFCAMTFGWLSVYAVVLQRLGRFLDKSRVHRTLEAVTGTVLVALGVRLAAETRG